MLLFEMKRIGQKLAWRNSMIEYYLSIGEYEGHAVQILALRTDANTYSIAVTDLTMMIDCVMIDRIPNIQYPIASITIT